VIRLVPTRLFLLGKASVRAPLQSLAALFLDVILTTSNQLRAAESIERRKDLCKIPRPALQLATLRPTLVVEELCKRQFCFTHCRRYFRQAQGRLFGGYAALRIIRNEDRLAPSSRCSQKPTHTIKPASTVLISRFSRKI